MQCPLFTTINYILCEL